MKHNTISIFLVLVLTSCSYNTSNKAVAKNDQQESTNISDSISEVAVWADEYISQYLDANNDRLAEVNGYPITYIKFIRVLDDKKFAAVKIGHNFEHRFVTEQWIYIDSLTKEIFELHTPSDSLVPWTTNSEKTSSINNFKNENNQ